VASARPTRAEASDVANAIFDGTDAVMLSQETAVGAYPVETVATMCRIAHEAESTPHLAHPAPPATGALDVTATVCKAAVQVAGDLGARAIMTFTESGATARFVSRFRPRVPIVGLTPYERTRRRMALYWGVESPGVLDRGVELSAMMAQADERTTQAGFTAPGDVVVIVAGTPGRGGATNRLIVHRVGEPDLLRPA
jgi:pyruvate kinase